MVAAKQIAMIGLEDPAEEEAEIEAGFVWREQLWSAMRRFCETYKAEERSGIKRYDAVAAELDRRWGRKGRPVSASVLKAALYDAERNNFRLEWVDWFARRDEDIARLIAQQVKPEKTPEQELEDLKAELREELSHKRAEQVLRRARAR